MFEVLESVDINPSRLAVIASKPSFNEAIAYVEKLGAIMIEVDADYQGCADAFLKDGRIIAIQPEGFKL